MAHQVDFLLLDDRERAFLQSRIGGTSWWGEDEAAHGERGCERFASTLAWAYWPSSQNSMMPQYPGDEASAMKPKPFRALISRLLGIPDPFAPKKR